jgi:L-fuconolactonase
MMRIDAHQHFWKYNPREYGWIDDSMAALRRHFLPTDLKPELEHSGFQGCIAVQALQCPAETSWLLELAKQNPFILGIVGWIDLRSTQVRDELNAMARDPKLVGIRHIVQDEPDDRFLLQPDFLHGIALLEEFDLAYDILIHERHLPIAAELVRRFPRQRFVLDHLGKPRIKSKAFDPWERGIREIAASPNVFCKLSGMVTEADWSRWQPEDLNPYLEVAVDCFGTDRLIAGSDWPVCLVAAEYHRAADVVKRYLDRYTPEVRDKVLGGNAQQFYKLKLPLSSSIPSTTRSLIVSGQSPL